jgi:hypothetical protein
MVVSNSPPCWKRVHTRARRLITLGLTEAKAWRCACNGRGPCGRCEGPAPGDLRLLTCRRSERRNGVFRNTNTIVSYNTPIKGYFRARNAGRSRAHPAKMLSVLEQCYRKPTCEVWNVVDSSEVSASCQVLPPVCCWWASHATRARPTRTTPGVARATATSAARRPRRAP